MPSKKPAKKAKTAPVEVEQEFIPVAEPKILSVGEIQTISDAFLRSGMFPDVKDRAQAIVKIMAGQELGIAPFAAMNGINIIQGRAELAANLMSAKLKLTGKYDYRVTEHTDQVCTISFLQDGKAVGESSFSMADAEKAGLAGKDNWRKYPKNMLFARALSNGAKWFAPDAFSGVPVYAPGELELAGGDRQVAEVEAQIVENAAQVSIEEKIEQPPIDREGTIASIEAGLFLIGRDRGYIEDMVGATLEEIPDEKLGELQARVDGQVLVEEKKKANQEVGDATTAAEEDPLRDQADDA